MVTALTETDLSPTETNPNLQQIVEEALKTSGFSLISQLRNNELPEADMESCRAILEERLNTILINLNIDFSAPFDEERTRLESLKDQAESIVGIIYAIHNALGSTPPATVDGALNKIQAAIRAFYEHERYPAIPEETVELMLEFHEAMLALPSTLNHAVANSATEAGEKRTQQMLSAAGWNKPRKTPKNQQTLEPPEDSLQN